MDERQVDETLKEWNQRLNSYISHEGLAQYRDDPRPWYRKIVALAGAWLGRVGTGVVYGLVVLVVAFFVLAAVASARERVSSEPCDYEANRLATAPNDGARLAAQNVFVSCLEIESRNR